MYIVCVHSCKGSLRELGKVGLSNCAVYNRSRLRSIRNKRSAYSKLLISIGSKESKEDLVIKIMLIIILVYLVLLYGFSIFIA